MYSNARGLGVTARKRLTPRLRVSIRCFRRFVSGKILCIRAFQYKFCFGKRYVTSLSSIWRLEGLDARPGGASKMTKLRRKSDERRDVSEKGWEWEKMPPRGTEKWGLSRLLSRDSALAGLNDLVEKPRCFLNGVRSTRERCVSAYNYKLRSSELCRGLETRRRRAETASQDRLRS